MERISMFLNEKINIFMMSIFHKLIYTFKHTLYQNLRMIVFYKNWEADPKIYIELQRSRSQNNSEREE